MVMNQLVLKGMLLLINNLLKVDSIAKILDKVNLAIIPMANIDGYENKVDMQIMGRI